MRPRLECAYAVHAHSSGGPDSLHDLLVAGAFGGGPAEGDSGCSNELGGPATATACNIVVTVRYWSQAMSGDFVNSGPARAAVWAAGLSPIRRESAG